MQLAVLKSFFFFLAGRGVMSCVRKESLICGGEERKKSAFEIYLPSHFGEAF